MRRLTWAFLVVVGVVTSGCIKSSTDVVVNADGSATIKMTVAYALDRVAKMHAVPDNCSCWRVYQIHESTVSTARRALSEFESSFSESKVRDAWKGYGLTVTKASLSDIGGWRTLSIEATTPDVAETSRKFEAAMKSAPKDAYLTRIPWYLHSRHLLPKLPRFEKAGEAGVVKVTIPVAEMPDGSEKLATLAEDDRSTVQKQLVYMRTMRGFDEGQVRVRVKLPGTVTTVENGRQDGTDAVVQDLLGSGIDLDVLATQARAKATMTATVKIDPEKVKIGL